MEGCTDFIEWLGKDMSMKILACLEDSSDLVRASAVSSSWRRFVIETGLCKQFCLRAFPLLGNITDVVEVTNKPKSAESRSHCSKDWAVLERDHRAYAFLAFGLASFKRKDCISEAISASSTDNYPEESVHNTLEANGRIQQRPSYWSSQGANNTGAGEALMYNLVAKMCVITEIHVQPFQAYFQVGFPIYSAKAVRFCLGHPRFPAEMEEKNDVSLPHQEFADDKFVWTYTSPEFPMAQENRLQKFRLPEPVLCIGGILKIELLGRVQKQEMDGLYYICVSRVRALGRPLGPAFDVDMLDPLGKCVLKYHPEEDGCFPFPGKNPLEQEEPAASRLRVLTARVMRRRGWEQMIINALLGNGADPDYDDSEDELVA